MLDPLFILLEAEADDDLMVVDDEEVVVSLGKKRKLDEIEEPSAKKLKTSNGATKDIVDDELIIL